MATLTIDLRNQLARAIQNARREAETGARKALESLAVHLAKAHDSMDGSDRALRGRLRAHGKQLGDVRHPTRDTQERGAQEIVRLAHEVAYEHWHRMLFARFLAENQLLIEPESGVAISMAECDELAREKGDDPWTLAGRFAQRMLPRIFRPDDPALEVVLPPETRQALERELASLPRDVFRADDSLGWTYQFWQADRKDEVNRSGGKIGADELPAVTQLFTEHYMVLFLFHNTIGAWRAGKILAERPELAEADSEDALRRAVRLSALGGYDFTYLRFVREQRDGDEQGKSSGPWRPAAGRFDGWPTRAAELRVLDPCCGSGHFLVEGFELLVRLRMEEDGLSVEDAIRAVLAENLFGLEIDPRCTQIAAFNLALAAWKLVGRPVDLPPLNISCAGLSVGGTREEWLGILEQRGNQELRFAFGQLYDLFRKAPTLGSLIDPRRFQGGAMLDGKGANAMLAALSSAVEEDRGGRPERHEMGVAAQGIARATELLRERYTLVITNVPFLEQRKQSATLRSFCSEQFPASKGDLACVFVERCIQLCSSGGVASLVTPQNWLFLTTYRHLRAALLQRVTWRLLAKLGQGAFETISGHVVKPVLTIIVNCRAVGGASIVQFDVSQESGAIRKATGLVIGAAQSELQEVLTNNPDCRIVFGFDSETPRLGDVAWCAAGIMNGDSPRFLRLFWELRQRGELWVLQQTTVTKSQLFGGLRNLVFFDEQAGHLREEASVRREKLHNSDERGNHVWGKRGVAVTQMSGLPTALYIGNKFDSNVAAIVPKDESLLPAVWAFCRSEEFRTLVERLEPKLNVTNATFAKLPFDPRAWRGDGMGLNQLPEPEADDPREWIFSGYPPAVGQASAIQVAVCRVLSYRWPAELDAEMRLSDRARELVGRCDDLLSFADHDGVVCLPSVRGEKPAADRLLSLLAAYGIRPDRDLDEWLRSSFFEEHCKLFHHRPFVWHIWDGREDGFHALVNYHRLAGPNGEGRRALEALTYSYLGDWVERQKAEQREGRAGADGRLAAAQDLQAQLARILAGEPPCDLFIRWKPLHEQPIGWDPDINDGVRLNIRPFMSVELRKGGRRGAGILRWRPNITWKKDRGTEPESLRPTENFPWFWGCPGDGSLDERTNWGCDADGSINRGTLADDCDGSRWNDLHYSNVVKQAARTRAAGRRQ